MINVYTVSDGGNFPFPITWENTVARTGGLVGSFKFPSGNELNGASVRVINSMQCSQIMTFRFSVADDMAKGGVSVDVNALSGLRVSYNC